MCVSVSSMCRDVYLGTFGTFFRKFVSVFFLQNVVIYISGPSGPFFIGMCISVSSICRDIYLGTFGTFFHRCVYMLAVYVEMYISGPSGPFFIGVCIC